MPKALPLQVTLGTNYMIAYSYSMVTWYCLGDSGASDFGM